MIMWIIFGVVVVLLIGFIVFSAIKDRIAKKKRRMQEIAFKALAQERKEATVIMLQLLVAKNQEVLDSFEPSIGSFKMSQVVDTARDFLLQYQQEKEFKDYVSTYTGNKTLMKHYAILRDRRSTLWKNEKNSLKFIEDEYFLIDQDNKKDLITEVKEEIEEFYNNAFNKKS
ncbi:hypothetical protein MCAL160_0368 [Mycoplasmopsis californica HAZ160_1]|uniref:DUF2489 domain-containing protein n=1 Tax=Mycoplasmopsis californica HAZ160_1 TaxID=1397850 RepID=A0AAT9F846_9BACT|nr:hypothetical protein [Mycoplasmopsis californica]BAP00979.1 hypothetical protein MCAL160_0368 [Mycoplasmopsis californica HAZ160_1]BBG40843.1 hypothetical protein MCAL106_0368 [Mycoplasmopsis californica]BBG41437.1 hypothetical protein MCAL106E_0368 [Mycoplasmopsis californica]BBG42030.1 hypothetical protein MCAL106L_0368 [Mycoplasmopsis californica]BBG42614.1 hypothetical protein MCAL160E_0368 [Mycoplasmopsis californica]